MLSDFIDSIGPQPLKWLPLNHFVNEVGCLDTPSIWNLVFLDLHLFRENGISDFLSGHSQVRSLKIEIVELPFPT